MRAAPAASSARAPRNWAWVGLMPFFAFLVLFLVIPTIVGGVLAHALNERYLRLFAFAAAPIQTARGFYPGYSDRGHLSAALWGSTAVELMVVAIVVLAVRYGRDEG